MMKMKSNRLLDIWNKYLVIDPEISCIKEDFGKELLIELKNIGDKYWILQRIIENSAKNIVNYFHDPIFSSPNLEPASGHKTFIIPDEYFGILDIWFPSEVFLFDITRNPILSIYILESLKSKFSCNISDITKINYTEKNDIVLGTLKSDIIDTIKDQEYWVYYLVDSRNSLRERSIKIRQVEITDVEFPYMHSSSYRTYLYITSKDLKTGETIYLTNSWNIYLSRDILESRLTDLESLWLKHWDYRVNDLDLKIKNKRLELKNLKTERSKYLNSLDEYRKKVKNILWKNF